MQSEAFRPGVEGQPTEASRAADVVKSSVFDKVVASTRLELVPDFDYEMPKPGEPVLYIHRHGVYLRGREVEGAGSLDQEWKETYRERFTSALSESVNRLSEDDRQRLRMVFMASPTSYGKAQGQRAVETSLLEIEGAIEVLTELGLDPKEHIANYTFTPAQEERYSTLTEVSEQKRGTLPSPITQELAVEPHLVDDQRPDFQYFLYLKGKYGRPFEPKNPEDPKNIFWIKFDEDAGEDREKRLALQAEGPDELLSRFEKGIAFAQRYLRLYEKHEKERLHGQDPIVVAFAVGHTDYISPFMTKNVLHFPPGKDFAFAEEGAGFKINVHPDEEGQYRVEPVAKPKDSNIQLDQTSRPYKRKPHVELHRE